MEKKKLFESIQNVLTQKILVKSLESKAALRVLKKKNGKIDGPEKNAQETTQFFVQLMETENFEGRGVG